MTDAPTSDLTIYGEVFCKLWSIPAPRTMVEQHVHDYDHLTILMSGRVRVFAGGDDKGVKEAPALIKIPAYTSHAFLSLSEDVRFACVHAVKET